MVVIRSPADILGLLHSQLDDDQDPATDQILNRVELARVEGAVAMLAAVVRCEPWPQWVDPPRAS